MFGLFGTSRKRKRMTKSKALRSIRAAKARMRKAKAYLRKSRRY